MKPHLITQPLTLALAALVQLAATAATPSLQSDHDAYYPGEPIAFTFANGPGNAKDWVGVYPPDAVPGPVASTIWRYVDNTQNGNVSLREGTVTFPEGLALGGDWVAYLLLNDAYTLLATNTFRVVDPGTPLVRVGARAYLAGQPISVTFTNGPGNAKDWVGIYKEGQTPGGPSSTLWAYVDGTQSGNAAKTDGVLSFPTGLTEPGLYVAHFLVNDTYDILASETFTVAAPSGSLARVVRVEPADASVNQSPAIAFSATLTNGTTQVVPGSIKLRLDGAEVPAVIEPRPDAFDVTFTAPGLFAPGSSHEWSLSAQDNASPANTITAQTRFQVRQYRNIVLPPPLVFEDFDAVPEGSLPQGWSQKSFTTPITETEDFGDLGSTAFAKWTAVNAARFQGSFVTYGNPDNPDGWETDYQRVLTPNPDNILNGAIFTQPLASGRFLMGNSGYQNSSASQVLYLFTPDFNLTGRTNIHLSFRCLWEQNQDSIAAIEYSIDRGNSWLPIAYFIDRNDIVTISNEATGEVTVDAEATFNQERADVARYTDDQGNEVGGTYGAFIAAPVSAQLAPFIQGRIDDDPRESKRIELFHLPAADNQPALRFRFAHAGTDSWYFGIDDFGVYSIGGGTPEPASLSVQRDGNALLLSWPGSASGAVLETSPSLAPATWSAVGGVSGNTHRVQPTGSAAYYRLRQ